MPLGHLEVYLKPAIAGAFVLNAIWTCILIGLFFVDYYLILNAKAYYTANAAAPSLPGVTLLGGSIAPGAAVAIGFILLLLLSASCIVQMNAIRKPCRICALVSMAIEALAFILLLGVGSKALSDIGTWKKMPIGGDSVGGLLGVMGTVDFFVLVLKLLNIAAHALWFMLHKDDHCDPCCETGTATSASAHPASVPPPQKSPRIQPAVLATTPPPVPMETQSKIVMPEEQHVMMTSSSQTQHMKIMHSSEEDNKSDKTDSTEQQI